MALPFATQLYNNILNNLLNPEFIEEMHINDEIIKKYIEDPVFKNQINQMVQQKDYSCQAVLSLCVNLMLCLTQNQVPEDWLSYIYQYILHCSFPHAAEIKFQNRFNAACKLYLCILRSVSQFQKLSNDGTWQSVYPLRFLTTDEMKRLENPEEYKLFLTYYDDEYLYEMMKLSQELYGYNNLDHVCGVHHLALFIGRQLCAAGLPVDLGRVSGAAAGHDIGKYGCTYNQLKRVPHLHYYYTDLWYKKRDIAYIGHIAFNHSVWDLELENLPLESLILIYCDFRVKNRVLGDNKISMHIFTLDESFDVILGKLDNVDEAKQKRYHKVYAKLKDFENYMLHLGVNTDHYDSFNQTLVPYSFHSQHLSLLQGQDIVNRVKYLAINHNISLMYKLRDEFSLNTILELARSENEQQYLREYLHVLGEYSTYLTQRQKLITLKFLYDKLIHPEDDIRRQCGELIGALIATFDEIYRKELPENVTLESPELTSIQLLDQYFNRLIDPDHKIIPLHREWLGYSIQTMVASLFSHCSPGQVHLYRKELLKYYHNDIYKDKTQQLYLLQTAKHIPVSNDEPDLSLFFNYIFEMLNNTDDIIRLSALDVLYTLLLTSHTNHRLIEHLTAIFTNKVPYSKLEAENYLRYKIVLSLNLEKQMIDYYKASCEKDVIKIPDIFLSNLKTATHWVLKNIQIKILLEYTMQHIESSGLHTAMHYCNLLKVSPVESVRNNAGNALVTLMPNLPLEQRNEVVIELIGALEIEGFQFKKYIPHYLGQLILYLKPDELDEITSMIYEKIKYSGSNLITLLLRTISVLIAHYPTYKSESSEASTYKQRLIRFLGMLLNGLVHYNEQVRQTAFSVIGKEIFDSKHLQLEQKRTVFNLIGKKILTLISEVDVELTFLTHSAGLNHIYRFISDYNNMEGNIEIPYPEKIAFFPGAFDPFSMGHKKIATAIRDLGFEVYLYVDEFSWSKRTHPNVIRKNIINLSIADELNVYLYPEDYPTNIANADNLEKLKHNFPNSEVYIAIGSDVILHASAYQKNNQNPLLSFSHIIFDRKSSLSGNDTDSEIKKAIEKFSGEVIRLSLPPQYEDVSSTQIRNYIDENRDISRLIDPLAQKYIYKNSLYRREPQYKTLMQTISIDVEVVDKFNPELIHETASVLYENYNDILVKLKMLFEKPSPRLIIVRDIRQNRKIIGFAAFHWLPTAMLFHELKNSTISEYVRQHSVGRIINIQGIFIDKTTDIEDLEQIILTETLAYCLARDYEYAIFNNTNKYYASSTLYETFKHFGFVQLPHEEGVNPVLAVNMSAPCTLTLDVETIIKEPFNSNKNVRKAIVRTRKKLQQALTQLYPGHLVLIFDMNMLHETLIKKICQENQVPVTPLAPRQLGPAMCVPYGTVLHKSIVPNTVTKSLHTEKMYAPDIKSFIIGPSPYYMDLSNQVKMLYSFNRPIILIDDLLHKGYRMKALDQILKEENVEVQKIIVGMLSGQGKELMDIQNREVDSGYFIPKLKVWFNEKLLYPFIGGDTLWRGSYPWGNLIPSINLILPYTSPTYISGTSKEAIYHLSNVAIENAYDLLTTLEAEYEKLHDRALTLAHLGEVFVSPRCPERGKDMLYDFNLSPSYYLLNDLEILKRMEYMIKF